MFNFCINNIVGNKLYQQYSKDFCINNIVRICFIFLSSLRKIVQEGNKCFYDCSFITEGAFTMEIEGAGINVPIYPTPPLGQDMTQGQFLSGV